MNFWNYFKNNKESNEDLKYLNELENWDWFVDIEATEEYHVYLFESTNLCEFNKIKRFYVVQLPDYYKKDKEDKNTYLIKTAQLLGILLLVDILYIGISYY